MTQCITSNLRGDVKFVIVFGQCIRKSIAYSELLALGVKRCTFSIERDVMGREFLEWSEPSQFDTLAPSIFFVLVVGKMSPWRVWKRNRWFGRGKLWFGALFASEFGECRWRRSSFKTSTHFHAFVITVPKKYPRWVFAGSQVTVAGFQLVPLGNELVKHWSHKPPACALSFPGPDILQEWSVGKYSAPLPEMLWIKEFGCGWSWNKAKVKHVKSMRYIMVYHVSIFID
jgi:hypothetical protein